MKYILLFVGLFLFLCTNSLSAQSANDTLVAWQYYQKADSLLTIGKHDTSIESFKKALIIYEEEKHWERVANSYNKISENQWRIRDFKGALKSANEALEINNEYLKKQNKEEAYSYKNIGICNLKTYKFTKSIHYLERSLGIEKKLLPEDHISIGVTYSYIGTVNKFLSKFQKALHYQEKALNIFIKTLGSEDERVANEYNNIGNIYSAKRRFPTALRYYEKDLEITVKNLGANSMKSAVSYVNIGTVYSNIGKSHKALTYYKKAIPIFLKEEKKYALFVTYNNIGTLLTDKGEYEKALNYNKKGLDMALKIFDQNHEEVAICNWNIGFALEGKKLYDKALVYYNKALRNITLSKGENNNDVLTLYTNIGNIYLQNKKYDKAFDYYQKALRIAENIHEATNPEIARVYISIGNLYNEKSSLTKALLNYEKSMDILENSEKQHPLFLQALNQIANVYRKKGVFRESLSYFDRALVANSKNETPNLILEEINPNHFYDVNFLLETIQGKAEVLYLIYKENKKTVDLKQSFEAYNKADLLIDYLRESYKNRKDKISFARRAKEVYQGAIKTQLLLHKQQGNPDELNKAFFFAEKSMGNILKELLNFSTTKEFRKLSADIISLEKDLKIDKAFYLSQVAEEQSKKSKINTAKVQEFENQLFDINRKQDSLTTLIETNYPKYYNLKYQNKVISVADIQSKLDEQTTLLEFFTSDNSTYTFTISKNNIDVQELATPDLANKVYGFKQSIISKDLKVYKKYANELYQELISPIASKIKGNQLIIVPDGPLWHLNFDLLLAEQSDANNPKELPYLVKEYIISYANSATLLFDAFKEPKREDVAEECLAFSFTDSTSVEQTKTMSLAALRDTGDDLPGTREEIKAISNIIDGQYYFGSQAIETNFKKNANKYNILHLALHGEVDNERPENSRLFFTKSNDTIEDNFLYSHELFALDIPAELTVLSACNTGSGKIAKGEGIMSLGNAFQYAGTKSLLLTSWEVSDQTTPKLMKYFYTNLKKGMNKAEALQQAKLQYINTADVNRVAPFYWGGFYLVGDPEPIQFANNNWWYWLIAGVMVLLILLLIRKTRRG